MSELPNQYMASMLPGLRAQNESPYPWNTQSIGSVPGVWSNAPNSRWPFQLPPALTTALSQQRQPGSAPFQLSPSSSPINQGVVPMPYMYHQNNSNLLRANASISPVGMYMCSNQNLVPKLSNLQANSVHARRPFALDGSHAKRSRFSTSDTDSDSECDGRSTVFIWNAAPAIGQADTASHRSNESSDFNRGPRVKGPWTPKEDKRLKELVAEFGTRWSVIAERLPGRIGKQCRERWLNHLDTSINRAPWTPAEDAILLETHKLKGNKWSEIAKLLPGRPENSVKNRYTSLAHKQSKATTTNKSQENEKISAALSVVSDESASTKPESPMTVVCSEA